MGISSSSSSNHVVDGIPHYRYPTQTPSNTNINNRSPINTGRSSYSSGGTYGYSTNRTGPVFPSTSTTYTAPQRSNVSSIGYPSFRQTPSAPTIDQIEEITYNRVIQHSLRENYSNNRASNARSNVVSPTLSSATSFQRCNNVANVNRAKIPANIIAKANPKTPANVSEAKGEMSFDCSICMEFNEEDVIVATECGHIFHKECVSTWIQQAGTCPTCRVRVTVASLRKIFITVNSQNNNNTNMNNNDNTNNVNNHRRIEYNTNRNSLSPIQFSRSIWLGSKDKTMTEQSLATYILQKFHIPSQKVTIKSLKKAGATQPPTSYVSFKINVDSESTFYTLNDSTKWPRTIQVREFVEF